MPENEKGVGGLHRLSKEETVLVLNYRLLNEEHKDVMMYLARDLIRQAKQQQIPQGSNVFLLTGRPLK